MRVILRAYHKIAAPASAHVLTRASPICFESCRDSSPVAGIGDPGRGVESEARFRFQTYATLFHFPTRRAILPANRVLPSAVHFLNDNLSRAHPRCSQDHANSQSFQIFDQPLLVLIRQLRAVRVPLIAISFSLVSTRKYCCYNISMHFQLPRNSVGRVNLAEKNKHRRAR